MSFKDTEFNMTLNTDSHISVGASDKFQFDMPFGENTFNMTMEMDSNMNIDVLDNVQFTRIVEPVDHNELLNRDAKDAHPISAITGLSQVVNNAETHINSTDVHVTASDKERWNEKVRAYRNANGSLVLTTI